MRHRNGTVPLVLIVGGLIGIVVLVVTIGAGSLFGTIGLILAAPLLSAAVHITRDLGHAQAQMTAESEPSSAAATS